MPTQSTRSRIAREVAWFLLPLAVGIALAPLVVYFVGTIVFGTYDGGLSVFYGRWISRLLEPDDSTWFASLTPWLLIVVGRLTGLGLTALSAAPSQSPES